MVQIMLIFPNYRLYDLIPMSPHQPPLSLAYLSAMCKSSNISFKLINAAAEHLSHKKLLAEIAKNNPIYVGITTNIAITYASCRLALLIRKNFPKITIIMGGPWAHANFQNVLNKRIADIVCFGESEYILPQIVQSNPDNLEELQNIPSIAFRLNGEIFQTNRCGFVENLDDLPFPQWDLFPWKKYDTIHRLRPFFPIITSRGCPYDCLNCTKIIHGYRIRYRSIPNVINELIYLKEKMATKKLLLLMICLISICRGRKRC